VSDDRTDLIAAGLAVSYGALALVLDAVIATGALVAQLLDALSVPKQAVFGPDSAPATAAPTAEPVELPAAGATALATGLPLAFHNVHQLRQLARHTGLPRWWSADRKTCLTALGALA
jgi:hypothetical protein